MRLKEALETVEKFKYLNEAGLRRLMEIQKVGEDHTHEGIKDIAHKEDTPADLEGLRKRSESKEKIPEKHICKHCKMDIRIRNPSGFCDHLHYPEYCKVCKERYGKDD